MTRRRKAVVALWGIGFLVLGGWFFVKTHPLVFNESFSGHAHCIVQAGGDFLTYASEHGGRFPEHTNGYGDALLLMQDDYVWYGALTGPGYTDEPFRKAIKNKEHLPEEKCGRVYVQGLNPDYQQIVILFDKVPTPGGDHCHMLGRLWTPLCREVLFADGSHRTVKESEWPEFAKKQVELLIAAGIKPEVAKRYYASAL